MKSKADHIYFLNLDIAANMAGIEVSALMRTRLFEEYLGLAAVFVTKNYNWNLHRNKEALQNNHRAAAHLRVLNMFDYLQDAADVERPHKVMLSDVAPTLRSVLVGGGPDARLYGAKGNFVAYCKRREDDLSVSFVNFLHEGKIFRRETYDSRGFLSKVDLLDSGTDRAVEQYLRPDGTTALIKDTLVKDGIATTLSIQLIAKDGRLERKFNSDSELTSFWISELVRSNSDGVFVVDRCLEFYEPLKVASKSVLNNIRIVPVIHSVHTGEDVFSGPVSPYYQAVLEDLKKLSAVIVFTEEQKIDILKRFGLGNIVVIPHSYEAAKPTRSLEHRDRLRIVYLARFTFEKQHMLAVQAFRRVVNEVPGAQLHLYGFGEKKQAIIEKIRELSLESSVVIHDFSHDVKSIYENAGLSILTSSIEGFCLGVMESLFCGCPVVSFDIKYGPRAMIKNGVNGFLVPLINVDAFTDAIVRVLNDVGLHRSLVENSTLPMTEFLHEKVAEKWGELLG